MNEPHDPQRDRLRAQIESSLNPCDLTIQQLMHGLIVDMTNIVYPLEVNICQCWIIRLKC
jgi:hypothetical protein